MTTIVDARTARRPRLPWVRVGAWLGAAMTAMGATVIVAFLVIGVRSGTVDWGQLFGSRTWDPTNGKFGAAAMIWGTGAVSALALALAAPVGWGAAVAITELAPVRFRRLLRTGSELLAVVPSIVFGLLGVVYVRAFVSRLTGAPGGDSLLTGALVLAVMILPTIVAVSVDALSAVPSAAREGAAALGLTRIEVIRSAVLPTARRGMGAAALLGLARAMGETVALFLLVGRADGRLPSPGGVLDALIHPGQTLTTKLNGPEVVLAGTSGPHWAALCALGLLLLGGVALLTFAGLRRARGIGPRTRTRERRVRRAWPAREARDRIGRALLAISLVAPFALMVAITVAVLTRGSAALHPSFWTQTAEGSSGGGVRDQLVGTLLLVVVAGAFAAPAGFGLGLLTAEYAPPRLSRWLRSATLSLNGVPSIILGLAGYWLFARELGWGKSWLAGGIVLSVVAVPAVAVAVAAAIDALPPERREAALAVGLSRDQVVRSVVVPRALPGMLTGALLGLARAAGETAPLLFTATVFSGAGPVPHGVRHAPVSALTTHVFALVQDAADPAALRTAWGAATVLLLVAACLLFAAVPVRRRMERVAR